MINLKKYEPKQTLYYKVFKKHSVRFATVANYLGLSYPYVINMLNGTYKLTPKIEAKLQTLVDQLEG